MRKLREAIQNVRTNKREDNLYDFDGFVPASKGFLFGLQHFLAMFFSSLLPFVLVASGMGGVSQEIVDNALRSALLIAGLATALQLFPLWWFGARLPQVMGTSFTFIGALTLIGLYYGLGTMFISLLVGGGLATIFALFSKIWLKALKPIVMGVCVFAIGMSLIPVGVEQFFSISASVPGLIVDGIYQFSVAWPYILVAFFTLIVYLLFQILGKGLWKHMAILFALIAGYLLSLCFIPYNHMVDFSSLSFTSVTDFINCPKPIFLLMSFSASDFNIGAIVVVFIVYLVNWVENAGAIEGLAAMAYGRSATKEEIRGGTSASMLLSTIGAAFGALPLTGYHQNNSIVGSTKVTNRYALLMTSLILLLISFFPPVSKLLMTIPSCVLGGALLCLFASIAVSGMKSIAEAGLNFKNVLVVGLSLALGFGVSQVSSFTTLALDGGWLDYVRLLVSNPVAMMSIVAVLASFLIPEERKKEKADDENPPK